jgi:putative oxidoreductase
MHIFDKLKPLALLLLRWGLGLIFIYHGYPKLFGQTPRFIESFARLGLPPYTVYLVGIVEVFGGALLFVGLFTRAAGLFLMADMAAAIWKYNLKEGVEAVSDYELPLVLGLATFALVTVGAGAIALDHAIFRGKSKGKRKD